MRSKFRGTNEDPRGPNKSAYTSAQLSPSNQPIKSPSPDKKSANIIMSTRSPEMHQYKNFHALERDRVASWHSYQQHLSEKPFPMNTPSKRHEDENFHKVDETQPSSKAEKHYMDSEPKQFSSVSNSRVRSRKIEIIATDTPEDFDARHHLSIIRDMNRSDSMEFDYIKLLKSKEQTIKELKEIIEMIKRSNTSYEEVDDSDRLKEYKERIIELNGQVRELKIQNQHLLNVIEKTKKSGAPLKDEILQREIRQLKITIKEREGQFSEASAGFEKQLKMYRDDIRRLQNENNSLLRLLKEKEEALGSSSLSIQSKASDKEKLTLTKIKQQYHQNLKLMKDNFSEKMQELSEAYHYQLEELAGKIDQYETKVHRLEMLVSQFQSKHPRFREKEENREEYHREKIRHQEIQSLMLQKYSKYEEEISDLKKTNDRLIQELTKANKANEDLSQKVLHLSQELHRRSDNLHEGEVASLIQQNQDLHHRIAELQHQREELSSNIQHLAQVKQHEAREYERKIEMIMAQYENHAKEEKNSFDVTISRLRQQLQQTDFKSKEIVDYYEKDKMDTEQKIKQAIDIYNRENQALKSKLAQKNNDYQQLLSEFQRLKHEHESISATNISSEEMQSLQHECEGLRARCQNLEKQVGSLNAEILEMDVMVKEKNHEIQDLQTRLHELQQEKESLSKKHSEVEIKNNDLTIRSSRKELEFIELQTKVQELEKLLESNEERSNFRISSLQKEASSLQQNNVSLTNRISELSQELEAKMALVSRLEADLQHQASMRMLENQPIEEDLKELKRIVCEFFLKSSPNAEKDIVEQFYKLNFNFETKLEQNLKLAKQAEHLKNEMLDMQRQRQILSEKVSLLEQNNSIYERQLKERRILYDQLLQEKSRIEKEILLSKKIKVEQSHIESAHRGNINEITSRIDRLLDIERQRNQNMRGLLVVSQGSPERR